MFQVKKVGILLVCIAIMGSTLIACGNKDNSANNAPISETQVTPTPAPEQTEATTRMFTDWTGHKVEIPVNPKRVIYHGEVTGDVLALGVVPVGVMKNENGGTVYDDLVANVEDVGFPLSLEKSLELNPDLIIFSNADVTQYEQISKIAPTVTFDSFAAITERMKTLGDLLGKQAEAEAWLTKYNTTMQEMWTLVHENGVKEGETASVFTMYPGNRLFIMAGAGLPQFLYEENGFKPVDKVQEIIDQEIGFVEISAELLNEYAGDRIFILNPVDPAAQQSTNELMESEVWKNLPAVKNGYVYNFDIIKAGSDALSRDWMIEELPKVLIK